MSHILKVLVVDDDRVQCGIIDAIALRAGLHVTCVSEFERAVDILDRSAFDFVTVDLSLGERNGVELLSKIAKLVIPPRVIIISGCDRRILSASAKMAHEFGIDDVVVVSKPIDFERLSAALKVQCLTRRPPLPSRFTSQIVVEHLEEAIATGQIKAVFQPKVRLSDGHVVGCEALARWHCPTLGVVPPDKFIAAAEELGLIRALTASVIRQSMRFARSMLDQSPRFVTSINLSATLLSDVSILDEIQRALVEEGIPACALIFEVTETAAIFDSATAAEILLQLRLKGCGVSIDDFGTGYSSLSVLSRMPFSELKIDRAFVRDCLVDADMTEIVRSSIALAHQFGMTVVAEGVEDAQTASRLSQMKCDLAQGYFYSPGVCSSEFRAWYDGRIVNKDENAGRSMVA